MRLFLLNEKGGDEDAPYLPVVVQEMEKRAKDRDFESQRVAAKAKAKQLEEEQKSAEQKRKEEEEKRKKEELSIENIPDDGVLSSPVTGKTVRKLDAKTQPPLHPPPRPHLSHTGTNGAQKHFNSSQPNSQTEKQKQSQAQTQQSIRSRSQSQPTATNSKVAQKRKPGLGDDLEQLEKLNRFVKKTKDERVENRKREIGFKT